MPAVLAIDPGRAKCGIAVVDDTGTVLHRSIASTETLTAALPNLLAQFEPIAILLGNGTGSSALETQLTAQPLSAPLYRVDERHTSEEARRRYLAETPARGWQRLIPRALRTPETPYDDFVAIILAERWWAENRD